MFVSQRLTVDLPLPFGPETRIIGAELGLRGLVTIRERVL